jgi:NAD(P)-dependent dehydrogenase (short-subunit alcohol dehydrogenase family)
VNVPVGRAMTDTFGNLAGRVAFVTGASRGIGRAIARRLAAHGAAIVVTSSPRSAAGLKDTCELIDAAGGRAAFIAADLAVAESRQHLIEKASGLFGPIEILVNNAAAITAYAPPSKIDLAARRAMFEVNLQAPIDLIQQTLPAMRTRSWGRVLNITSGMARQPPIPYPGPAKFIHALSLYGTTKAALDRYTVALAAELHGTGVHVNALAPYKIALSEAAMGLAAQTVDVNPDWLESVEVMAEAAYVLTTRSFNGLVTGSRELLALAQQPLHALDGRTVIGDALTLFEASGAPRH